MKMTEKLAENKKKNPQYQVFFFEVYLSYKSIEILGHKDQK